MESEDLESLAAVKQMWDEDLTITKHLWLSEFHLWVQSLCTYHIKWKDASKRVSVKGADAK